MKKGEKKKKGFTIIEVSLVIAIAGLIFLMVFVALPALQRSQRDSRRRDDILMFLETVKKYQNNNRGALPTEGEKVWVGKEYDDMATQSNWQGFYESYLGDSFTDPSGNYYVLFVDKCSANKGSDCNNLPELSFMDYTLHVYIQATCSGEKAVGTSNPKNIAVMYRLEGSGIYCANT